MNLESQNRNFWPFLAESPKNYEKIMQPLKKVMQPIKKSRKNHATYQPNLYL